jgi:hypothetical protein
MGSTNRIAAIHFIVYLFLWPLWAVPLDAVQPQRGAQVCDFRFSAGCALYGGVPVALGVLKLLSAFD